MGDATVEPDGGPLLLLATGTGFGPGPVPAAGSSHPVLEPSDQLRGARDESDLYLLDQSLCGEER